MKIGVIGYGNMGSMIVNNILQLNLLLANEELIVSNRHIEKIEDLIERYPDGKFQITDNNTELAKSCEKIIISVTTPNFKEVIEEISPFINEKTHIIYTCAGLDFKHINSFFDGKLTLVIPSLASTVTSNNSISSIARRKGITLIKHNDKVEIQDSLFIEDLFNEFSYVKTLKDKVYPFNDDLNNVYSNNIQLEIGTILTSCGPAFIAIMIEKFAEMASNNADISKNEAEDMILKTLIGTAILKEDQKLSNEEIIEKVATKGGITAEGVDLLDKRLNNLYKKLLDSLLSRYVEVNKEMDEIYLN
ncbi:MAG: NAD(P)-binding domain-containing protein [Methanobrevibacter sp.]|nr:NAD(P)-binding domain-containing protein [Methanobrevibacter sp.]